MEGKDDARVEACCERDGVRDGQGFFDTYHDMLADGVELGYSRAVAENNVN